MGARQFLIGLAIRIAAFASPSTKVPDIALVMREIERVLKPNGLCFVNFMSVDDPERRPFNETAYARRLFGSERWAQHQDDEADAYFANFLVLHKEKRAVDKVHGQGRLVQTHIDYIARKHGPC